MAAHKRTLCWCCLLASIWWNDANKSIQTFFKNKNTNIYIIWLLKKEKERSCFNENALEDKTLTLNKQILHKKSRPKVHIVPTGFQIISFISFGAEATTYRERHLQMGYIRRTILAMHMHTNMSRRLHDVAMMHFCIAVLQKCISCRVRDKVGIETITCLTADTARSVLAARWKKNKFGLMTSSSVMRPYFCIAFNKHPSIVGASFWT